MPHAVLVELDWDGSGGSVAFAGELPGCAVFATTPEEAVAAMPVRVSEFVEWLNRHGESLTSFAGGNWYEVERVTAEHGAGGARRAIFSLDELPPSEAEFERYMRWLELAREELAEALDRADVSEASASLLAVAGQDARLAGELGNGATELPADPLDAIYDARDQLTAALAAAGSATPGARGVLRIAISDDLRVADGLHGPAGH